MKHPREPLLSWTGYLILNGIVVLLCLAVWMIAKSGILDVGPDFERPGIAAMLIFIPACFFLASLYDALYDRLSNRRLELMEESEEEAPPEPETP